MIKEVLLDQSNVLRGRASQSYAWRPKPEGVEESLAGHLMDLEGDEYYMSQESCDSNITSVMA